MGTFFTLHFCLMGINFLDFFHLPNCMWEVQNEALSERHENIPYLWAKGDSGPPWTRTLVRTHYGVPLSNGTVQWIHPVSGPGAGDTCWPNSFKVSSRSGYNSPKKKKHWFRMKAKIEKYFQSVASYYKCIAFYWPQGSKRKQWNLGSKFATLGPNVPALMNILIVMF